MRRTVLISVVTLLMIWVAAIAFKYIDIEDDISNLFDYTDVEMPENINIQRLAEIESAQYATLENPFERFFVVRYVAREIRLEEDIITTMSDETQGIYVEYDAYIALFIPYAEITNDNGSVFVHRR